MLPSLLALVLTSTGSAHAGPIDWRHDDWPSAKQEAIKSKKLVAVDVWATWCHTCLSMKNFVLTDEAMRPVADTHVWLSLDYDNPYNTPFFAKVPVDAFPTFLVVDPVKETVVARWVGAGTAAQMAKFYGAAKREANDPVTLGQRALAVKDYKKARGIFEKAMKTKAYSENPVPFLAGWIEAVYKSDEKRCAKLGLQHMKELDDSAPALDYASYVAMCAESAEEPIKREAYEAARAKLEGAAANASLPLSVDDRSSIYEVLYDVYEGLGTKEKIAEAAKAEAALLEEAASKAKTPAERTTFDAHRLSAYLRLERWEDAEKMLLRSETDFPRDFNHSYRLALLYLKQARTVEGLAAADRALAKGYGPRRMRLYSTKIDLLIQAKKYAWARKTIEQALAEIAAMDKALVREGWKKGFDAQMAKIEKEETAQR